MIELQAGRQRVSALERANLVKRERERLLGGWGERTGGKLSRATMAGLVEDPPEVLLGMPAWRLLTRTERFKATLACRWLEEEKIGTYRLVGELTARQRQALASRLRAGR